MHFNVLLVFLSGAFALAQNNTGARPTPGVCTKPRIRKSWHRLSKAEKSEYLRAVKCLWLKPARGTSYFAALTRHDDYASLHVNQTTAPDSTDPANRGVVGPGIHFNGVFLPWHRYAVWTYENTLIEECGYKGAQPYWDWSLDTPERGRHFHESPVFDPVIGFGGNGINGTVPVPPNNGTLPPNGPLPGSCVPDGPFANLTNNIGPGFNLQTPQPHCLIRNINDTIGDLSLQWKKDVIPLLQMTNYTEFYLGMSFPPNSTNAPRGIHGGGHSGVGGEMQNVWSSINDPLFFMHHAMIDYVWWVWQRQSTANFNAMYGPIYPNGTGITTLDYPIYMSPFIALDVPIRRVMDTQNKDGKGVLCYVYQDNGQPTL